VEGKMKVVDQTPFFNNETGEISLVDRGKAIMKFGLSWIAETEAQRSVMPVLENVLDKNFTLLRNVTLPGLETSIPFILIGPPGVYVLYVTNLNGMLRAKGEQWGTISGNSFKPEKPNLLTRTERMSRAVQVFLQRQKYGDMVGVEAILLCANPGIHVDSLRPIVRVVMRDALERFASSIMQARVLLTPEAVHDIVNRLLAPPKPAAPKPTNTEMTAVEAAAALSAAGIPTSSPKPAAPAEESHAPAFNLPNAQPAGLSAEPLSGERFNFDFSDQASPPAPAGTTTPPVPVASEASAAGTQDNPFPFPDTSPQAKPVKKKRGLSRGQVIVLIVFGVIELLILVGLGFFVITNIF
jgi:hypothetical protein